MRLLSLLFLISSPLLTTAAEAPPIQEWIDAAITAGGGVVTVPEGEHELPRGLVIKNAKKLALRGINTETCILKLAPGAEATTAGPIIQIIGSAETLEIAKLTLSGTRKTGGQPPALLRIKDTPNKPAMKNVVVRDCLFQNFLTGVEVTATSAFVIERCSLRDGSGSAVLFRQINGARATGNRVTRTGTAFELQAASACLITGNETLGCLHGVSIHPGDRPQTEAHQILNNAFLQCTSSAIHPAQPQPPPILKDLETE